MLKSATLSLMSAILLANTSVMAQSLNVGQTTVPRINRPMPTVQLPDQTNSLIMQSQASSAAANSSADTNPAPNATQSATENTPSTRNITRSASGVQDTAKDQPAKEPAQAISETPTANSAHKPKAYVSGMVLEGLARVYDGHSLMVGDDPVRLNGIDAPGLKQICSSHGNATWRCGQESKDFLSSLVDGKKVTCVVDGKAGTGAAATCSSGQTRDIATLVVEEGYAVVNQFGHRYQVNQDRAIRSKSGLWSGSFTSPVQWRLQNPS